MNIDFENLKAHLLSRVRELLPQFLPGGRVIGSEFHCGSLRGETGNSLKVNLNTGLWADFAGNDTGGDLISLYAAIQQIGQAEAAHKLSELTGFTASSRTSALPTQSALRPMSPPSGTARPNMIHDQHGAPSMWWSYLGTAGEVLFYVARYDTPDGKQIIPWSWHDKKFIPKGWPAPRPLYGLELLSANPNGRVLVVEGEKAAEAARKMVWPNYIAVTWSNGSKAVSKTDWSALYGREILLWPDADKPGMEAMRQIAEILASHCSQIKIIFPEETRPVGWDAADLFAEGIEWPTFKAWAKPLAQVYVPEETTITSHPTSTPSDTEDFFNPTDLGNAKRLVLRHGHDLRYCHLWKKWLVWNGQYWIKDETGEAERRAKETILSIYNDAQSADHDVRAKLIKHALKSENAKQIKYMLDLATSEPHIPINPKQLDRNPWLLNCKNGTLNLLTGEFQSHDRKNYISKLAPVSYDATASCSLWENFLLRIMNNKTDTIQFLQRAIGYALTGITSEQVLFFLYGSGANGKSTFLEVIRACLGDYAQQMPTSTLMVKHGDSIPNDVARLQGSRFATASEISEGKRLSEELVKQLTGSDTISARFMRAEFFEFEPEHKIFVGTNHKPEIRGTDDAIWRRIRLIPFTVTIPAGERDQSLQNKLRAELPGILAWAVRGCLEWKRAGLGMCEEVRAATEDYRKEMDVLSDFFEQKCTKNQNGQIQALVFYTAYKQWCEESGEQPLTLSRFGKQIRERGIKTDDRRGKVWYLGIGLINDGEDQRFVD